MLGTTPFTNTFLHEAGHKVSIVNPACIGGFAKSELSRTKTDKVDAALIACFCAAIRPSLWTPPPDEVKQLQALVRRLEALKEMQQQESNRLETATTQVIPLIEEHLKYLKQDIHSKDRAVNQRSLCSASRT